MIEITNVSMSYGPVVALSGVSFEVEQGEILGLLGPNGAGKSTLMKVLTTFLYPTEGTARLLGHDVKEDPLAVRAAVGYLPETAPLYADMRVDEYLNFVGRARAVTGETLQSRLAWLQEACKVREVWKHTIFELSKGYRQRVGLAQALIHDPDILILDEPTSGLDPLQIIEIRRLIRELATKKTIIFSTHILQEVEALADRIVIINNGEIISQGTRDELKGQVMGEAAYHVAVRGNRRKTEKKLQQMPGVTQVISRGPDRDGFEKFEVMTKGTSAELRDAINQLIQEEKFEISLLSEAAIDLEETFIALLSQQKEVAR